MELNATVIGQFITFFLFIWVVMRFVWPPLIKAMEDRKQKIAEGLADGERGKHELELAQGKSVELIREGKVQAAEIIDATNKRSVEMIEEARENARQEGERQVIRHKAEIERETQKARHSLKEAIAALAIESAEKILDKNIDKAANDALINKIISEI